MSGKTRKARRTFTEEFKKKMVDLHKNGKSRASIIREYSLTPSSLNNWIKQYSETQSFKASDNRSDLENELIEMKKKLKRAEMELDILKQATLIIGRKEK